MNLKDLREIAEAATPGVWPRGDHRKDECVIPRTGEGMSGEYIQWLKDTVDEQEAELESLRKVLGAAERLCLELNAAPYLGSIVEEQAFDLGEAIQAHKEKYP